MKQLIIGFTIAHNLHNISAVSRSDHHERNRDCHEEYCEESVNAKLKVITQRV